MAEPRRDWKPRASAEEKVKDKDGSGSSTGDDSVTEISTRMEECTLSNRVHRRVILRDCWMPIGTTSSLSAPLGAFKLCIEGHESLHNAGFLHRGISVNNLMVNENDDNPSWFSFLIDLDLAIRESREAVPGAKVKTGTRTSMAIGALLDMEELAKPKLGIVTKDSTFVATMQNNFTAYYSPLIPLLKELRKAVFPRRKPWEQADEKLYARMREILRIY
ncbi:uncharacterized protein FFNC_15643 [Fusarium fujikuroi]|nr:uncharacterized protein FFNC_15643 [Fusarium fujikuroi]